MVSLYRRRQCRGDIWFLYRILRQKDAEDSSFHLRSLVNEHPGPGIQRDNHRQLRSIRGDGRQLIDKDLSNSTQFCPTWVEFLWWIRPRCEERMSTARDRDLARGFIEAEGQKKKDRPPEIKRKWQKAICPECGYKIEDSPKPTWDGDLMCAEYGHIFKVPRLNSYFETRKAEKNKGV